jgi:hypothetical protein
MTGLTDPSALEKLAGNVATESALTVAAALLGGPLAPVLPILTKSLAAGRQARRVEDAIALISETLARHEALLVHATDEQYKLLNELVLAVLQTTQAEKLQLLRNAIENALQQPDLSHRDAALLARIVRDISVDEAAFLARSFQHSGIEVTERTPEQPVGQSTLLVRPDSDEALSVSGLLSLGILAPGESAWSGIGVLRFTKAASKVLAILRRADA